jgi:hypothetical protein
VAAELTESALPDDVEGEGIPEHLNHMIQILLEEADAMDGGRRGTGPCLELFLQERILPILCHLGETDVRLRCVAHVVHRLSHCQ